MTGYSPPGNLYCSIVLSPQVEAGRLGEISLVTAPRGSATLSRQSAADAEIEFNGRTTCCGRPQDRRPPGEPKLPDEPRAALIVRHRREYVSPEGSQLFRHCVRGADRVPKVSRLLGTVVASSRPTGSICGCARFAPVRDRMDQPPRSPWRLNYGKRLEFLVHSPGWTKPGAIVIALRVANAAVSFRVAFAISKVLTLQLVTGL